MAARLVGDPSAAQRVSLPTSGSTAFTRGALVYITYASDRVDPATSSAGSTVNLVGVAAQTIASTATFLEVILINQGQIWEMDCTAATASNQLLNRQVLTDSLTVNNTSSDTATTLGIALQLANVGATADNKALFKFLVVGQVTA